MKRFRLGSNWSQVLCLVDFGFGFGFWFPKTGFLCVAVLAVLKLTLVLNLPVSASQVMESRVCTTTPGLHVLNLQFLLSGQWIIQSATVEDVDAVGARITGV